MGFGKGKGGEMSDHCITFSVLILNVFCGLLGMLVFGLAFFFRFEGQVRTWVNDLGMNQYWTGLYILMAASAIVIVISICGCTGALTANSCLLATCVTLASLSFVLLLFGSIILLANYTRYSVNKEELQENMHYLINKNNNAADMFLIFLYYRSALVVFVALILELAGGIYIIVNGTHNSNLTPWLQGRLSLLIRDSNYNDRANTLLNVVQENVGCCGSYNYQDFDRGRLPIPESCRDKVSGNVYQDGCVKKFSYFIEKRTGWISGIALFIGFLQIILVCLTFVFWKRIRDEEANGYKGTKYSTVPTSAGRY